MTFASKITLTRMALIPVFVGLALAYGKTVHHHPNETLRIAALVVFILAATSDALDGWIARRFNQRSDFGAFIDPIADKGLLLSGVVTLSITDWGSDGWRLPAWFAVLVVLRDCLILGGIGILYRCHRNVKISPHWTGKVCTVTQMFALGWVMLRLVPIHPTWPCAIASLFTVWSMFAYITQGMRILKDDPI